jgi:4'-phosphopantetheinyl transferase EntD
MINRLFSPEVVTQVASPDIWDESLYPEEEALTTNMVPIRKREFTAGRLCVRKALDRLGIQNFPVLVGENREPLWPPGIIGSVSHCKGFCGAVVARRGSIISIGLDVEPLEPMTTDVLSLVCTPGEKEWLLSDTGPHRLLWPKLVFSAKESAFKCYFPLSQTYLDFQDVEVRINPDNGSFSVSLLIPPPPTLAGVRVLNGRFSSNDDFVYTGVDITSREIF